MSAVNVYHALNRASARATLFEASDDYRQFEQVLDEARARTGMRILAYCLMPNHWHLVLWPAADGTLSRFVTWLTLTHTQRWHARQRRGRVAKLVEIGQRGHRGAWWVGSGGEVKVGG
jgi:REP element-mobilizing transposase RayT